MKKRTIVILAAVALSLALACGAGIGRAYAYFTTYVQAYGVRTIHLGDSSQIDENYTQWHKDITITNKGDSYDAVYVRAKAFAGSEYKLVYSEGSGWKWNAETGYYDFAGVLAPGESTSVLAVDILGADGNPVKIDEKDVLQSVNIVVVYETTPAVQDGLNDDGSIHYEAADWSRQATKQQTVTEEAEEEGGND